MRETRANLRQITRTRTIYRDIPSISPPSLCPDLAWETAGYSFFTEKRAPTAALHTIWERRARNAWCEGSAATERWGLSRGKRPRQGLLTAGLPGVGGGGQGRFVLAPVLWHEPSRWGR